MKNRISILCSAALLGAALMIGGCGDDDSAPTTKETTLGTVTVAVGGTTGATAIATPTGSSLNLAAGTVFTDAAGAPIAAGPLPTVVSFLTSTNDLSTGIVAAKPAGSVLRAYLDINMGTVKNISPPMTAKMPIPGAAPGTTVNIYSITGTTWTFERTVTVAADGTVTFPVSHLSGFAGTTGGTGSTGSTGG